jgi:hypothetical protein
LDLFARVGWELNDSGEYSVTSIETLLAVIGAGGGVTFAALQLYEKICRPRIEEGPSVLTRHLNSEASMTLSRIQLPMDPRMLQQELNMLTDLNSKWRRSDTLLRWRRYQVGILVLLAIFAVPAYLWPDYPLFNVPVSSWAVVVLLLLVGVNGVFLWYCIELDRFIDKLKTEDPSKKPFIA